MRRQLKAMSPILAAEAPTGFVLGDFDSGRVGSYHRGIGVNTLGNQFLGLLGIPVD